MTADSSAERDAREQSDPRELAGGKECKRSLMVGNMGENAESQCGKRGGSLKETKHRNRTEIAQTLCVNVVNGETNTVENLKRERGKRRARRRAKEIAIALLSQREDSVIVHKSFSNVQSEYAIPTVNIDRESRREERRERGDDSYQTQSTHSALFKSPTPSLAL